MVAEAVMVVAAEEVVVVAAAEVVVVAAAEVVVVAVAEVAMASPGINAALASAAAMRGIHLRRRRAVAVKGLA
jgi:hypothetical protein